MAPTGTCAGKHDLQLQIEMTTVMRDNGLKNSYASFERRRGRVCVVAFGDEQEKAVSLFLERHPDFSPSRFREDTAHGTTKFIYFRQD